MSRTREEKERASRLRTLQLKSEILLENPDISSENLDKLLRDRKLADAKERARREYGRKNIGSVPDTSGSLTVAHTGAHDSRQPSLHTSDYIAAGDHPVPPFPPSGGQVASEGTESLMYSPSEPKLSGQVPGQDLKNKTPESSVGSSPTQNLMLTAKPASARPQVVVPRQVLVGTRTPLSTAAMLEDAYKTLENQLKFYKEKSAGEGFDVKDATAFAKLVSTLKTLTEEEGKAVDKLNLESISDEDLEGL